MTEHNYVLFCFVIYRMTHIFQSMFTCECLQSFLLLTDIFVNDFKFITQQLAQNNRNKRIV